MFENERKNQFSLMLEQLANSLDISEARFKEAEDRYQAVGKFLERDESIVAKYIPVIYTQGSFRLGTVIKPVTDAEEYDLDLVCQLNLAKNQISQKQLKEIIGFEIKGYAKSNNMKSPAEEGKRCWTLHYSDGAQFHMDILPCIPDSEIFREMLRVRGIPSSISDHAIAITDNTMPNYADINREWPRSNPKGYAEWFKNRMKIQFESRRFNVAKSINAKAEDVPEYKVKTTLQRSIQLLKRHRDIMFQYNPDDKPISMIITTLAAHAYNNEADLYDALNAIIHGMPNFIFSKDDSPWIPNPVNPDENFADKWKEHPEREENFRKWIKQVYLDLEASYQTRYFQDMLDELKPKFGDRLVNHAAAKMPTNFNKSAAVALSAAPSNHISNPSKPWAK
jgi:hypothetical protein